MTKRNGYMLIGFTALALAATGCTGGGEQAVETAPYAGYENRDIAALPPERTDDLLNGRGAGYALAAEVNGFPGPKHSLEMEKQLQLTDEQKQQTERLFAEMKEEATKLGAELVGLERELDHAFKSGEANEEELQRLIADIAETEGRLRFTHLSTHLKMKTILTDEQTAKYIQLRGYGDENAESNSHSHGKH